MCLTLASSTRMQFLIASLPALFFSHSTAPSPLSTLSLHDALPIFLPGEVGPDLDDHLEDRAGAQAEEQRGPLGGVREGAEPRSEEHTSELQSRENLVCRLLLEKKKRNKP